MTRSASGQSWTSRPSHTDISRALLQQRARGLILAQILNRGCNIYTQPRIGLRTRLSLSLSLSLSVSLSLATIYRGYGGCTRRFYLNTRAMLSHNLYTHARTSLSSRSSPYIFIRRLPGPINQSIEQFFATARAESDLEAAIASRRRE